MKKFRSRLRLKARWAGLVGVKKSKGGLKMKSLSAEDKKSKGEVRGARVKVGFEVG